jgi:hypothetical protein
MSWSIRLTEQDQAVLIAIASRDGRVGSDHITSAINYSYQDIADEIDKYTAEYLKKLDTAFPIPEVVNPPTAVRTTTFNCDEKIMKKVSTAVKKKLGMGKIRVAFLTRLVIRAQLERLQNLEKDVILEEIQIKEIQGVKMISELADLLQRNDKEALRTIIEIRKLLDKVEN